MTVQQKLILVTLFFSTLIVYALFFVVMSEGLLGGTGYARAQEAPVDEGPAPEPTRTLRPTYTATPTSTPTPTATDTPMPTDTPTATPAPTDTPTNTPRPVQPTPTEPQATPVPTDTPVPEVDYRVAKVRRMSACENNGNHNIYVTVLDKDGKGMPWVKVWVSWGPDGTQLETGHKPEMGDGYVDFPMFKGTHSVKILDAKSEVAEGISPDIPVNERCDASDNDVGNSLYHYSYEVVFQKTHD